MNPVIESLAKESGLKVNVDNNQELAAH